jgi:hypothetical protein
MRNATRHLNEERAAKEHSEADPYDSILDIWHNIYTLGDETATVLDRLHDNGRSLIELGVTVDLPKQWVSSLTDSESMTNKRS